MTVDQWEGLFSLWAQGPGKTEQDRCDNAVNMIKSAIAGFVPLKSRNLTVFAQGSYRNRTNVRQDSDVDVCVCCSDTFYYEMDLAPGATRESLGLTTPATYDFPELKREIGAALIQKFGSSAVTPGDKAFDIHETSYRVDADVVPTFVGRDYLPGWNGDYRYREGTVLQVSSSGQLIYNWPQQHYDNGVAKHSSTGRRFKKVVRVLKRLRYKLEAEEFNLGKTTSSYLLESLVYNCPDSCFGHSKLYEDVRQVIAEVWSQMKSESTKRSMTEVNGIKYLFHPSQSWTIEDAQTCLQAMWSYIGFE